MSAEPRTARSGPLSLTLLNRTGKRLPVAASFAGVLATALRRNALRRARSFSLTLLVTGDAEMRELAGRYASARRGTDVLAFEVDAGERPGGRLHLGDVVISRERAAAEAGRRGISSGDEMRLYALHGLLHLLGYDDSSPAERERMFSEQAAVLGRFGGDLS